MSVKNSILTSAIILGVGYLGIRKLKKSIFGEKSTARFPENAIDFDATQKRYMVINTDPFTTTEIDDPWHPSVLAITLQDVMSGTEGIEIGVSPRSDAWKKVSQLGIDRGRWLHNYWLDHIDSGDTLFRWISAEYPTPGTETAYQKNQALNFLKSIGAGF